MVTRIGRATHGEGVYKHINCSGIRSRWSGILSGNPELRLNKQLPLNWLLVSSGDLFPWYLVKATHNAVLLLILILYSIRRFSMFLC